MTIRELSELADEAKQLLVADFSELTGNDSPTKKELLTHLKNLYNKGDEENILNELFLDDVDCPSDFYKLLLLFAVSK